MKDTCELPVSQRDEVPDVGDIAPGEIAVPGEKFRPSGEALRSRPVGKACPDGIARLDPVDEHQSDIGKRVAERTEFPVEDRGNRSIGIENAVVEAIVAMNDGGRSLLGYGGGESRRQLFHDRHVPVACGLPLSGPARNLALDIGLLAAEIAESAGVDVDGMNGGEHFDEGLAGAATCLRGKRLSGRPVPSDHPVDEVHDVKGRPVDSVVGAESDEWWNRHVGRGKCVDDLEFTTHVVGGGEHVTQRRATEHPTGSVPVRHPIAEVRESASDEVEAERWGKGRNPLLDPSGDISDVDAGNGFAFSHGFSLSADRVHATRVIARAHRETKPRILALVSIDVTDETFEADVLERSMTTPVVVDLWAPWCGPCTSLGPILESVIDETAGEVILVKVNIDENPAIASAFKVQSIPAVFALDQGKVVSTFVGAQPEAQVREFVTALRGSSEPTEIERLREIGDEASLRSALELEPDNEGAIIDLAELLAGEERGTEALELLARIPETPDTRRVAALVRSGGLFTSDEEVEARLNELLEIVKGDDDARQQFIDLLELLGPDDPRTTVFRRKLTTRLF